MYLCPSPAPLPPRRGLPPPCWSDDETFALIESYREKWPPLRFGNLRAADWEEVAAVVTRRCSHVPTATPKTSVQCRHKIEKLRKRFRSERHRSLSLRPSSSWPFFSLMKSLENPSPSDSDPGDARNTRSHHRQMANSGEELRFAIPKALRSKIVNPRSGGGRAAKLSMEEMRRRLEKKKMEGKEKERDAVVDMASALRTIGDGFMRMERMKMDMARKTEKIRLEMELKRTEMILDLHSRVFDALVKK
ncbi:trihelix transcription factor ASIL1-like [Phalaenopsis equestris]|uniref:trihelix transcription factor ASIL1-like n=1 Tax=Phalaenopsis equestris TaxID=78828 RepID=UPI0009E5A7DA|nr:trihelix transcription factor ASIL1-like [Phalaenopsis equestris]